MATTNAVPFFITAVHRRIFQTLLDASATSPDRARPLDDLPWLSRRQVKYMVAQGAVKEAAPGRYYLDERTYAVWLARTQSQVIFMVAVMALVALGVFVFARFGR